MSPVRATFSRTVGRANSLFSTAFSIAAFLSVSAILLARALEAAEGGALTLGVLWATSVAPVLPVLAAFLGMDVWSDEKSSGRMDALLTVAVRERDYVLGKFFGVYFVLLTAVATSLASTLVVLGVTAADAVSGCGLGSAGLAFAAVALQGMLWSAVSVMTSAMFRHASTSAVASILLLAVLPRGLWEGLKSWSAGGRTVFGEMPLDAHVVDIASGLIPMGTVVLYVLLAGLALLVASKCVAAGRLVGRGAAGLRLSTGLSIVLAALLGGASAAACIRLNPSADLVVAEESAGLSPRTHGILSETYGAVSITAFLPRTDPAARSVARLLRSLKRLSASVGGARIDLRFVDPRWDVGAAERLVRRGAAERSVVFERGHRTVSIPVSEAVERICVSTIRRVCMPPRRHKVCWTVGHGESRFNDYGTFGMSDIARELFREGFSNETIDLASSQSIPSDCALILIAGAKDDFSRVETDRLNAYLHEGGRLLVLLGSAKTGGVVSLLPTWGMRPEQRPLEKVRTLSGSDVIVSDFSDHPISAPLRGSRIILEKPLVFAPSAVAESGSGVDRIGYSSLASVGNCDVVAAIERGGGAGADLAIRPTRVVVLGDVGFAANGQLAVRASANRDFFLNSVSWLSGSDVHGSGDLGGEVFRSGMDQAERRRETLLSAGAVPLAVLVVMLIAIVRRRNRS